MAHDIRYWRFSRQTRFSTLAAACARSTGESRRDLAGAAVLLVFLLPLGYVVATAFKLDSQMTTIGAPLWPAAASDLQLSR